MRGKNLSDRVSDNDPHQTGNKPLAVEAKEKSLKAKFSAVVLNKFLEKSHEILDCSEINKKREKEGKLKANYLLVRGAGIYKKMPTFKQRYGLSACCIAGGGLYKGVARAIGMRILKVKGATGTLNTNLDAKINAAKKALKNYDFVFVHIKGTDILGHDGKCIEKKTFIEKIDKAIKPLVNMGECIIVITGDHSTPCELKDHSADPVPLMIHPASKSNDEIVHFSEKDCSAGSLGRIKGLQLMKKLFKIARQ